MSTFERWLARKKPHELAWSISLAMFAVAAAALAAGAEAGWNQYYFRIFYLFGAILNVPYLALGTIYLQASEKFAKRSSAVIVLFSLFALGTMISTPLTHPIPLHTLVQGSKVFPALPRILAGVGSGGGAIIVFGGAVYSLIRTHQTRFKISNILIALGTAISGASGLFNSVFDQMAGFAIALSIGIAIIFSGFLVANSAPRPSNASPVAPLKVSD